MDETCAYIRHLSAAIDEAKTDYIASAVTELAAMRDDLHASAALDLSVLRN